MSALANKKIGRNDPCLCGSGVKYKKCCLATQEAARLAAPPVVEHQPPDGYGSLPDWVACTPAVIVSLVEGKLSPGRGTLTDAQARMYATPYGVAKLAADPRSAFGNARLRQLIERHVRDDMTPAACAALSTEAIEELLVRHGVRHSRERFLELAAGRTSAWSISEAWVEQDALRLTEHATDDAAARLSRDVLGLAACELWRRWLPERPSIEMLDDWMQEGYRLREQGHLTEACDRWWQLWCALAPRFPPELRSSNDTSAVFFGLQFLTNWVQDLQEELSAEATHDRRYAEYGRALCERWLAQFPDDSDLMRFNFQRALASFNAWLGRVAEAAQLLNDAIERWPENPWTYIAAADAYGDLFDDFAGAMTDHGKAVAILERGLGRVPRKAQDYGELKERLMSLKARK